jgi:hypothetical protein
MSEAAPAVDDQTLKFGLLMESAQAHQTLAEVHLAKLQAHTRDLDGVVREEIRRTLIDELKTLTAETERAARALRRMKHAATARAFLWNMGLAILCAAVPAVVARYALPSPAELAALRAQRDSLLQNIAGLEQRGGKVDWRNCGEAARLCVRVDRKAPAFGEKSDYYVVKGY